MLVPRSTPLTASTLGSAPASSSRGAPDGGTGPTPAEALAELVAGNRRFVAGQPRHGHHIAAALATAAEQHPYAVVLGCLDSRVAVEAVFDQDFGDVCVVRAGGHVLDRAVLGSLEFTVAELRVPLVLVLGHERCGAVEATVAVARGAVPRPSGHLGYLVDAITPAVREVGAHRPDAVARTVRRHVARTVTALRRIGGPAEERIERGWARVAGAVHDMDTGRVRLLD